MGVWREEGLVYGTWCEIGGLAKISVELWNNGMLYERGTRVNIGVVAHRDRCSVT